MSCGGGACASSFFPDPNNRSSSGRAYQVNNPRASGAGRRPTYFSPTLHRASALIQNPASATLREVSIAAFLVFALYNTYCTLGVVRYLLFVTPVARVCTGGQTALGCTWVYLRNLWSKAILRWFEKVLPWAFAAAVGVFFAEEAVARLRGMGGKK